MAFEIIDRAIPPRLITDIRAVLSNTELVKHPTQTGAILDQAALHDLLVPVLHRVNARFGQKMTLRLDKSSYRVQPSLGDGALPLHQDIAALTDGEFKEPCCTVWLPLHAIDDFTPTLELSPKYPGAALPHKGDSQGYSVLADLRAYEAWPRVAITSLPLGAAVLIMPFTLHRTYVRSWHKQARHSLDLRFFP